MAQVLIISNSPQQTATYLFPKLCQVSREECALSSPLFYPSSAVDEYQGKGHPSFINVASDPAEEKSVLDPTPTTIISLSSTLLNFPNIDGESLYEPQYDSHNSTCRLALATKYRLSHRNKESESKQSCFESKALLSTDTLQ